MIRRDASLFDDVPEYPFEPHWMEWNGIRIHYLDEGDGPPVVLFHGEPTWSFLYRNVIPHIVESGHRVIAPDFPGFGKSDVPAETDFYTYDRLVEAMTHLVDELGLHDATAVVQDWGGPIGLRTAVERRGRFRRLVIMNTGLYAGAGRVPAAFAAWQSFVERTPDLPIEFVMRGAATRDWPDEVLAAYMAPFPTMEHKVGAARLPLIVPTADDHPGALEMQKTGLALTTWDDPVLVLFADQDPIFSTRVGQRFVDSIPGAEPLEVIEGAGHFLQEEEPDQVGSAITAFLARTT